MRIEEGMGSTTLGIDTSAVANAGKEIVGEALSLIDFDTCNMNDFQKTLNSVCQINFPYQLQPVLQAFIKAHHDGYIRTVLQDRQAIGDALQKHVATKAEITEIKTEDLFK
jgi:hypothetical protein